MKMLMEHFGNEIRNIQKRNIVFVSRVGVKALEELAEELGKQFGDKVGFVQFDIATQKRTSENGDGKTSIVVDVYIEALFYFTDGNRWAFVDSPIMKTVAKVTLRSDREDGISWQFRRNEYYYVDFRDNKVKHHSVISREK